jgi:hypothetical protein
MVRTVPENYIEGSRSMVLQQYFLFTSPAASEALAAGRQQRLQQTVVSGRSLRGMADIPAFLRNIVFSKTWSFG